MPAPLMVGSSRLALALRRDEAVRNALALASRADVALVGVGTFGPEGSGHIFIGYEDPAWSEELRRAGAVGHTCGRHFDADGNPIDNEATRRVIGVQLESLRAIPVVVGVAYGPEKVRSIRGALRGGYLHHLVTDAATAQALLAN